MKKFIMLMFTLFSGIIFSSETITVYTSRHYDVDKKIYKEFEKETGIKVIEVQNKDANALIKKLELEGENTSADVFMTVGAGDLYRAKSLGLLKPINASSILLNVPLEFRDIDNTWVGMTYRARIFVYNPEKVKAEELSTYENLTNKKWKGRILTRSSTSSYNQHLISFMLTKNGEKSAKKWAKDLVQNFARDPKGNDRDQAKEVLKGTGDIAIMNSYYMGRMSVSKDPLEREVASKLKIYFPNQKNGGTHINVSGVGLVKHSKNTKNAIRFIEFLTTKKVQEMVSSENFEYPENKKAKVSPVVKSWGDFKASEIDFSEIGKNLEKSVKIANEANWK